MMAFACAHDAHLVVTPFCRHRDLFYQVAGVVTYPCLVVHILWLHANLSGVELNWPAHCDCLRSDVTRGQLPASIVESVSSSICFSAPALYYQAHQVCVASSYISHPGMVTVVVYVP